MCLKKGNLTVLITFTVLVSPVCLATFALLPVGAKVLAQSSERFQVKISEPPQLQSPNSTIFPEASLPCIPQAGTCKPSSGNQKPSTTQEKSKVGIREATELLQQLRTKGDVFLGQNQYKQAFERYEQAQKVSEQIDVEQCGSEKTFSDSELEPFLENLLNLGLSFFRLSKFVERQEALIRAETVLTKVVRGSSVFSLSRKELPSQIGRTFPRGIEFNQTSSIESGGVITCYLVKLRSNYVLSAKALRILQHVYLAQERRDAALIVSEAGRTIQVDTNIAYNLLPKAIQEEKANEQNRLFKVAENLSSIPVIKEIQQIAKDENLTVVSYSFISDEIDPVHLVTSQSSIENSYPSNPMLLIWVIQPTGQIWLQTVFLPNTVKDISGDFSQIDSSSCDRGRVSKALAEVIRGTRNCLGISDLTSITKRLQTTKLEQDEQLQKLYQILIEPISDLLPTDEQDPIVIVPEGSLFFVPFAALQNQLGQYLIEKHTMLTAPNLRTLVLNHRNQPQHFDNGKVLVVGNPVMPKVQLTSSSPEPLSSLPGAEREANEITELFKSRQFRVEDFIAGRVTKKRVIQEMLEAQIVHFATHGILSRNLSGLEKVNSYSPLEAEGAIALSPDGKDNGLLTASEILNMELKRTDLVVLSACNTGRGPLTAGGVIGLPFSLSLAGVSNVVVSLWAIPDAPTAELMTEFYRQLLSKSDGKAAKAKALRYAMLKIKNIEQYKAPKNWAAFTLIGSAK